MDNKILARALLDMAQERSKTTFIEANEEIILAAKKFNIVLPSPDLAIIKTVYAEIDKINRNGVILPRDAAKEGLPTLVGKQINWEHDGAGRVCGYIIDAKINEDEIEIIGVIFKSLFPEEMAKVKERFLEKKLAVSFEIWNINPETKESSVHMIDDNSMAIDPIIFHGMGLLTDHKPACPKAIVYKLEATELSEAEKIVENIFEPTLIYASLAVEKAECKNCGTCTCHTEEEKVEILDTPKEEISAEEPTKIEEPTTETKTEVVPEPSVAETKVEETSKIEDTQKAEETPDAEVVAAPVKKLVRITTEETIVTIYAPDEQGSLESRQGYRKVIREFSDGTKEESISEFMAVDTYTLSQLEEKVNSVKAEKDLEIAALKVEHEKIVSEKIEKIEAQTKELGLKDQEIAKLTPKVEEIPEMTVGAVSTPEDKSETKIRAEKIDEIIARKHQTNQ